MKTPSVILLLDDSAVLKQAAHSRIASNKVSLKATIDRLQGAGELIEMVRSHVIQNLWDYHG
jgi:hypothetical protein